MEFRRVLFRSISKGKISESAAPDAAAAYERLSAAGKIRTAFNWNFLTGADSTDPTLVGIWGAFKGSLITMFVTLIISFPVGVLSALYLEEYAPRNGWTDMIEVSINNLAAVPSIIFGLLGLAVRSEEHTSELQSLMRISYAVFCLKKKRPHVN